ncbi:serine protease 27-like [Carettochelys insculpta]|uniref:serine protease 27-like n=1 Tax=Carettochelys insculpta TaxID=44489 RepID=UPI003EBB9F51
MGYLCGPLAVALLVVSLVQGTQGQTQTGCGKQSVSGRILNGQSAQDGAWPWHVSVQKGGSSYCSGVLISASWVLSVAQCFAQPVNSSEYRVELGEKRIFDQTRNHTFSAVKQVIPHPSYNSQTGQADIALVELEKPVAFTSAISPVCLLQASVRVPDGKSCWVTGWGNLLPQSGTSQPSTLQQAEVPVVDSTVCNNLIREGLKEPAGSIHVRDDMMCAGPKEGYKGATRGDFGGPLVCEEGGTWYLAGIFSWFLVTTSGGVLPGYPGVYNRPNAYNDWIQKYVPGATFTAVSFPTAASPSKAGLSATLSGALLLPALLRLLV